MTHKTDIPNPIPVGKLFILLTGLLFTFPAPAQTLSILADFTTSTVPIYSAHPQSFENSLTTQAAHRAREQVREKDIHTKGRSTLWLTALYIRPAEDKPVDRTMWPLVPALLLEVDPTLFVSTPTGPKPIAALRKGDVLYRYNPITRQLSAWEVGIVKRKSRRAESPYSLVTENGGFLSSLSRVALEK